MAYRKRRNEDLFTRRLDALLEFRDMNQKELADASGLDRSVISLYMNGRRKPSYEALVRLAEALDVTPAAFFCPLAVRESPCMNAHREMEAKTVCIGRPPS